MVTIQKKYCTIYLARHGETNWNQEKIVQGHTDTPLNENGIKQAGLLGEKLKHVNFDAFFSSDLSRAKHTAEIIALKYAVSVQTTKALRERSFGKYEGKSFKLLNKVYKKLKEVAQGDNLTYNKIHEEEGLETDEEVATRLLTFLREIAVANPGKTIFIACHGGVMRVALNHISGEVYKPGDIKNTAYLEVKSDGVDFFIESMYGVNKL